MSVMQAIALSLISIPALVAMVWSRTLVWTFEGWFKIIVNAGHGFYAGVLATSNFLVKVSYFLNDALKWC